MHKPSREPLREPLHEIGQGATLTAWHTLPPPETPLLDKIDIPQDLRTLPEENLGTLADELRAETISAVSETGGHLGAGLGVVELTIALHYIFDTPRDLLIWDVGHQAYPHKILTGRRDRIRTLRRKEGLSGFTRRGESPYDPFGAAHSSTSLSAGLGFATARNLMGGAGRVICVIGDGAMSAGMAYEAMNNVGIADSRFVVVLNDNDMSIARPVGAMSGYLSRLLSSRSYQTAHNVSHRIAQRIPRPLARAAVRAEEYARGMLTGGTLFEELGFFYIGPVDGHSLPQLLPVLRNVRAAGDKADGRPILLHVVTKKGKGYPPAEAAEDKFHGVSAGFDRKEEKQEKVAPKTTTHTTSKTTPPAPSTWTKTFSDALIDLANRDEKIVAMTAAMPSGTGLDRFADAHPTRCFDVGIAEQHGVTFCAGMAAAGLKPFATIYSTFLQRAYDQVVHDVALQSLPVRFVLDRAGLVGADGPTHHGSFDIAYLCCLPNFVVMAPSDGDELVRMLETQRTLNTTPSALRFPRGALPAPLTTGTPNTDEPPKPLPLGKGRILEEGSDIAILSFGALLSTAKEATKILGEQGISTTLADARFAKPLDAELVRQLARNHARLAVLEEGAVGGFATQVFSCLATENDNESLAGRIIPLTLPDTFLDHGERNEQLYEAQLTAPQIASRLATALKHT